MRAPTYLDRLPAGGWGYRMVLWVASTAFSFELLFVLFLFAGRFKHDPRFREAPVDLTALFLVLSLVAGLYVLLRRGFLLQRRAFILALLFTVFAAYAGFSLMWAPLGAENDYAREKALYIAALTLWPLFATAFIIAYDVRRCHRLLLLLVLFSSWVAVEAFLVYLQSGGQSGEERFITALGGGYLGVGRVLGLGALVTLAYLLFFARLRLLKVAALMLFGFFMAVLLVAGGRGPFLATVLAALVPLLAGWRFSGVKGLHLRRYVLPLVAIIGVGLAVVAYLIETGTTATTLARILALYEHGPGASGGARIEYYTTAISLFLENPIFGHGIGSWPMLVRPSLASSLYPHNIFLEIMVELGFVGLVLFFGLLIFGLRTLGPWRLVRTDPVRILIAMLFVNTFINALVSGDIPANRVLFAVLGLMMFTRRHYIRLG